MYSVVYTAGEEGYVPQAEHLPLAPEYTEDVAAARSSFLEAFMMARDQAADEMMMADEMAMENMMVEQNAIDQDENVVVESLRRKRSSVTSAIPAPTYPLSYSSYPVAYSPYHQTYTYPLTHSPYHQTYTYPLTHSQYPLNYAMQYPYISYPTIKSAGSPVVEKVGDLETDLETNEEQVMDQSSVAEPLYLPHSPVVRIGFNGLQPVQLAPGPLPPVQINLEDPSPKGLLQQGDDEPAALAL